MGRKKVKPGKNMSFYLSFEAIRKINIMSDNKSAMIEALINKEYNEWLKEDNKKRLEMEATKEINNIINDPDSDRPR